MKSLILIALLMFSGTVSARSELVLNLTPQYSPDSHSVCRQDNHYEFRNDRPRNKRDSVGGIITFRHYFGSSDRRTVVKIGGFVVGKSFDFRNRYIEQQCLQNIQIN